MFSKLEISLQLGVSAGVDVMSIKAQLDEAVFAKLGLQISSLFSTASHPTTTKALNPSLGPLPDTGLGARLKSGSDVGPRSAQGSGGAGSDIRTGPSFGPGLGPVPGPGSGSPLHSGSESGLQQTAGRSGGAGTGAGVNMGGAAGEQPELGSGSRLGQLGGPSRDGFRSESGFQSGVGSGVSLNSGSGESSREGAGSFPRVGSEIQAG